MNDLEKTLVLNVDDYDPGRYARSHVLRQAGFHVMEAATGNDAMRLVAAERPGVVLLDVNLPDMTGYEVCRLLKGDPGTSSIPILHVSATFVQAGDRAFGLETGADAYLTEPVEPAVLVATVKSLLRMRRAEDALRISVGRWQTTFNSIRDGVALLDLAGEVQQCNAAFSRIFAKSGRDLIGRRIHELWTTDADHGLQQPFLRMVGSLHRETAEMPFEGRWFQITADPVMGYGGDLVGCVFTVSDVTERKWAAEALQASEGRVRRQLWEIEAIYNTAPIGLCVLDPHGRYLRINERLAAMNGIPAAEHIGRTFHEIIPDVSAQAEALLRRVIDTGEPLLGHEIRGTTTAQPGVERIWVESWFPFRDETGRLVAINVVAEEVTERKRAEDEIGRLLACEQTLRAEAEAANRAKDEFLATLSHELRAPLNAILMWTQLLRHGTLDAGEAARALEIIERNTRAQAQLVEDLLEVSRIIAGKLKLDLRPIDLAPAIQAIAGSLMPAAKAKGVHLESVLGARTAWVSGDPDRLQQVVRNLLSNAIKFTPEGGRAEVRLEATATHARIVVQDTGQGIAADFLPHVFDRFRQADGSSARTYSGLGLGLAIVRHLVDLHGGMVRAESAGPGAGATFTVELPLATAEEFTPAPERGGARPATGGMLDGLRILAVDDEAETREVLAASLGRWGAQIMVAASAGEALKALEELQPDILVADIGMPGEDGYALIRAVRGREAARGARPLPAVALTAYAMPEDRDRVLSAGYQAHVSKPVETDRLLQVIADLAGRKRSESTK